MPYLDCNIPSNIYYTFADSEILNFVWTASDINVFVILSNCLLKSMQKQGSKRTPIISILNKIFDKRFTVFNFFADTGVNFIKLFSLPLIRTRHIQVCLLHSLFLLLAFDLSICLPVFSWVVFLYCNFTLIWCYFRNWYLCI